MITALSFASRMFPFPGRVRQAELRERWKRSINRADLRDPSKLFEPQKDHIVCSRHFVDGKPTSEHPVPELFLVSNSIPRSLGDEKKAEASQGRKRRYNERELKKASGEIGSDHCETFPSNKRHSAPSEVSHSPSLLPLGLLTAIKFVFLLLVSLVRNLKSKNSDLHKEIDALKLKKRCEELTISSCFSRWIKNDKDCQFFTGVAKKSLFSRIHDYVAPFVNRRWRGRKTFTPESRKFRQKPKKFGPRRQLRSVDEFLLTMMKLRLGLKNQDLAQRFGVSPPLVSQIFHSWLAAMDKTIGQMIYWPSMEELIASKPKRFSRIKQLRAIIDCSEIFIQTPKDPNLQNATWSNYKHHNTVKFLIAVAPNSAITFISPLYGGRTTDKEITLDSGFLDKCEPYDAIQADKGFNISQDCDARLLSLHIPPGKRGQIQMTKADVKKTKNIANLRILVEQVIRRLKSFSILSNQMPVTLLPSADQIIRVCASLCNLREPIFKQ